MKPLRPEPMGARLERLCAVVACGLLCALPVLAATNTPPVRPPATSAATTNAPVKKTASPNDTLWTSANALLKQSKWREAEKQFDKFADQALNDARYQGALYNQGLCRLKLGQESGALELWNKILQWDLGRTNHAAVALQALDQVALYYAGQDRADEEAKCLARMRAEFPNNPLTATRHAQAAGRKFKAGDYADAVELYKAAGTNLSAANLNNLRTAEAMTATAGLTGQQLLELANKSLEENALDQAIKLYRTFLEANANAPSVPEAKTKLGWCYYLRERFPGAEKLWQEVIAQGSPKDDWVGQSRWQLIVLMAGPYHKADEAQKLCLIQAQAFEGKFKGEQALFTRAWLYWTQKKWVECKAAFEDLIRAYPEKGTQPTIQVYLQDCENGMATKKRTGS